VGDSTQLSMATLSLHFFISTQCWRVSSSVAINIFDTLYLLRWWCVSTFRDRPQQWRQCQEHKSLTYHGYNFIRK